ncbi:MAG: DUF4430 domain-containing protein [Clostridia bacterium]|nr:DUF4430 domain-containing protein [Clostridia bacterium]
MKTIRKTAALALCAILVFAFGALAFSADKVTLLLRVEGIDGCMYCEHFTAGSGTVAKALAELDAADDTISFVGLDVGYVSQINDVAAPVYGGWDGWMYLVNGEEVMTGVTDTPVADGDEIIFYYADPFGAGFQKPEVRQDGEELIFTSADTIWNDDGTTTVVENPVAGMTVYLGDYTLTTDENGAAELPDDIAFAQYPIQVERKAENGCPTVLRFAPDTMILIDVAEPVTDAEEPSEEPSEEESAEPAGTEPAVTTAAPAATAAPETTASPETTAASDKDSETVPTAAESTTRVRPTSAVTTTGVRSTARTSTPTVPKTGEKMTLIIALAVLVIGIGAFAVSYVLSKNKKGKK